MNQLHELLQKRADLVKQGREVTDKAANEKRSMTAEENQSYDRIYAEITANDETRARVEKQIESERSAAAGMDAINRESGSDAKVDKEHQAFRSFIATGDRRGLQADSDVGGGFLKAPKTFVAELIKAADNVTFMRQKARKFTLSGTDGMGAPSIETDAEDATWTAEIGASDEDTALAFGRRELKPHKLSKLIKISNQLMRVSALPADQIAIERMSYKKGITEENAYMNGSGAGQPLGIFTASASGIPTSRDVSTDNTTTAVTFDGLINAKYSLKANYQGKAEWVYHRDLQKQVAKLKDGEGQYLWQPSKSLNEPDLLLGRPVNQSEYAPNTFTTGQYVAAFGDFDYYWIADSLSLEIQRLNELYAATDQVGFILRSMTDGMPVLGEAFARVKLG